MPDNLCAPETSVVCCFMRATDMLTSILEPGRSCRLALGLPQSYRAKVPMPRH